MMIIKNIEDDDFKLEMVRYKKAISSSSFSNNVIIKRSSTNFSNISTDSFIDSSNSILKISSLDSKFSFINTSANSYTSSFTGGKIGAGLNNVEISLDKYSSVISSGFKNSGSTSITQFGLVKMTGTEGNLKNGYTIGKDAKNRAMLL